MYCYLIFTKSNHEKPEDVAFDFYGSAELHWLVLYANNIVDRYHQCL